MWDSRPRLSYLVAFGDGRTAGGRFCHVPWRCLFGPNSVAAGTHNDKLAVLTGGGWENLYLDGAWDGTQEGNDGFFAAFAGGASWDDVQYLMLTSPQYFSNANNPLLGDADGNYTFGVSSGVAGFAITQVQRGVEMGQIYFSNLGTGTFTATALGNFSFTGTISGLANGPSHFTITENLFGRTITGTLSGTVGGQTVTGSITPR